MSLDGIVSLTAYLAAEVLSMAWKAMEPQRYRAQGVSGSWVPQSLKDIPVQTTRFCCPLQRAG